jgi:hypothetical protein
MKVAFIVNPASRKGQTLSEWRSVVDDGVVDKFFPKWKLFLTQRPGHATELVGEVLNRLSDFTTSHTAATS